MIYNHFLQLAWRNVLRNTRRSFLTGLVITLGIMFVFTARGFLNGLQREIRENISKGEVGEIQITRKGFREALPARAHDYFFIFNSEIEKEIKSTEGISNYTARLQFAGMINHQKSQTTTPFIGVAINPEQENIVCPRMKDVIKKNSGLFLDSSLEQEAKPAAANSNDIEDATVDEAVNFTKPVSQETKKDLKMDVKEVHQILIGSVMQKGFSKNSQEAIMGDELVLLTQDLHSTQKSMVAKITGIIDSPNPMAGKTLIYMVLSSAQELLSANDQVTHIVLSLKDSSERFHIVNELNRRLARFQLMAEPWDDINTFFSTLMALQNTIFSVIMAIIIIFVIVAIIITSMMTVAERTREIGTFMAIGYRRSHILVLFLMESGIIGFAGGIAGFFLGSAFIIIAGGIGIPFTVPGTDVPILIRPYNDLWFIFAAVALGLLAGVIGAFYPAKKASHLSPIEAMVHI